jgi:hypothetical protein
LGESLMGYSEANLGQRHSTVRGHWLSGIILSTQHLAAWTESKTTKLSPSYLSYLPPPAPAPPMCSQQGGLTVIDVKCAAIQVNSFFPTRLVSRERGERECDIG